MATDCQREQLSYVIGTEVPVPGGEASAIQSVHITHVEDAANTLRTHQKAFIARGLTEALTRVIAIVVQPGVEFDHSNIIHYQPQEAQALAQWIENTRMVYEAHSTDYQTRTAYWELVRDHFAILVNVAMLLTRMTRVVNVDIWNIWHMTFTGALLHLATGSWMIGMAGVVIHAAFVYKLGDWFARDTRNFFELEGIAIPHGTSAYMGPIEVLVDAIIEKIPGVNRIKFSADDIQRKFGPFGEPVTVGFVMGLIIGILAGYDVKGVLQLAVKTAAVMLLMPRVIKPIMDGLTPIAKQARSRLQAKFGGQEFLIGLDPALLLGHTAVVSASLIFIPLTILIAVCVPGNQVLPFGDLATIGFFVAMAVAVHRGNLFRTLISGVIIMSITLWIATQTIGLHTQLAANAGALKAGGMVASMDQGGSPITWLLIQVFSPQNIPGFIIIGAIYLTGIFMTWRRARGFIKQEKVVLAE